MEILNDNVKLKLLGKTIAIQISSQELEGLTARFWPATPKLNFVLHFVSSYLSVIMLKI